MNERLQQAATRIRSGIERDPLAIGLYLQPLLKAIDINMSHSVRLEVSDAIAHGMIPFFVSNHDSHANILGMCEIVKTLMDDTYPMISTGAYPRKSPFMYVDLPIAHTVDRGQGAEIKGLNDRIGPWVLNHGIIERPVIRRKDDVQEIDLTTRIANHTSLRSIMEGPAEGRGMAIFLAGTVDEARIDSETGNRKGLKRLDSENVFTKLLVKLYKKNKGIVVIPIAFDGFYTIIDPAGQSLGLTDQAKKAMRANLNPFTRQHLASATILKPMYGIDLMRLVQEENVEETRISAFMNNHILSLIAQSLPPEARGDFQ